ncbi:MAG: hypothetical protein BGO27_05660 [Alphaproteobacteria bacterium 33-17]|mgnify:CR=1 FL=1|nr:MAG: hypothetical protein BGO27_05660 [Alphaproteobacteria bacterium 33-17]
MSKMKRRYITTKQVLEKYTDQLKTIRQNKLKASSSFEKLPDLIIENIFSYLNSTAIKITSKYMNSLPYTINNTLLIKNYKISARNLREVLSRSSYVNQIILSKIPKNDIKPKTSHFTKGRFNFHKIKKLSLNYYTVNAYHLPETIEAIEVYNASIATSQNSKCNSILPNLRAFKALNVVFHKDVEYNFYLARFVNAEKVEIDANLIINNYPNKDIVFEKAKDVTIDISTISVVYNTITRNLSAIFPVAKKIKIVFNYNNNLDKPKDNIDKFQAFLDVLPIKIEHLVLDFNLSGEFVLNLSHLIGVNTLEINNAYPLKVDNILLPKTIQNLIINKLDYRDPINVNSSNIKSLKLHSVFKESQLLYSGLLVDYLENGTIKISFPDESIFNPNTLAIPEFAEETILIQYSLRQFNHMVMNNKFNQHLTNYTNKLVYFNIDVSKEENPSIDIDSSLFIQDYIHYFMNFEGLPQKSIHILHIKEDYPLESIALEGFNLCNIEYLDFSKCHSLTSLPYFRHNVRNLILNENQLTKFNNQLLYLILRYKFNIYKDQYIDTAPHKLQFGCRNEIIYIDQFNIGLYETAPNIDSINKDFFSQIIPNAHTLVFTNCNLDAFDFSKIPDAISTIILRNCSVDLMDLSETKVKNVQFSNSKIGNIIEPGQFVNNNYFVPSTWRDNFSADYNISSDETLSDSIEIYTPYLSK